MKKFIIALIILAAIAGLVLQSKKLLDNRKVEVDSARPPVAIMLQVSTATAHKGTLVSTGRFLAQIQARKGIKLSTKLAGTIEKIHVYTGQKVHKGDPLITIDSQELRSNISALEGSLAALQKDLNLTRSIYEANVELYRSGALPRQKLDQSRVGVEAKAAKVESTRQKVLQLKHQLGYLDIKAPFDGQIDAVMLHEGDLAATGRPIVSMSNGEKKLVFGFVPTARTQIKPGQPVFVSEKQVGTVRTLYATSQNGLVNAEVALDQPIDLPVGASIEIAVALRAAQGCILPDDTLIHHADTTQVMVYDPEGRFVPMNVQVRARHEGEVIVDPCPDTPVARGSEVRLSQLPAYEHVLIQPAGGSHAND